MIRLFDLTSAVYIDSKVNSRFCL